MSILIKGMKMPAKGYRLILVHADGTVQSTDGETKAVPVPPHGDLIDRDALCEGRVSNDNVVICAKCAPTIIPAEEGE